MAFKKNLFENFDAPNMNCSLDVTMTGHVHKEREWICQPHFHDYMEIFFCTEGAGSYWMAGKEYAVKKGDIVITNPYITNYSASSDEGFGFYFLGIGDFCYPPYPRNTLFPDDCPVFSSGAFEKQLQFYFQELLQETSKEEMVFMPIVSALANLIALQVIRIHRLDDLVSQREKEALSYSLFIKKYIDQNYSQAINLDTLSEASFISKSYISHQFKKNMGLSPIDYLIKKRMEIARHLLTTTSYSVAEVAKNVGYDNPLYFSSLFRKNHGMSPSEYRKHYRVTKASVGLLAKVEQE